jgi:hypothetical protein
MGSIFGDAEPGTSLGESELLYVLANTSMTLVSRVRFLLLVVITFPSSPTVVQVMVIEVVTSVQVVVIGAG